MMNQQEAQARAMALLDAFVRCDGDATMAKLLIADELLSVHNEAVERAEEIVGVGLRWPDFPASVETYGDGLNKGRRLALESAVKAIRALKVETKP
jgi:hypothetical protein